MHLHLRTLNFINWSGHWTNAVVCDGKTAGGFPISCCASPQGGYCRGADMKTPYEVETLIAQMGGPRIFAMAFKSCAYATSPKLAVTFAIAPSLKRAAKMSHVRVTLEPSDTYKVEFLNVRGTAVKTVGEFDDVYCDQLKGLVESKTGLYLSL